MKPVVSSEFRVEGERADIALPYRDRVTLYFCQYLHPVSEILDPGRADEHRRKWWASHSCQLDFVFEAGKLATESVATGSDVDQAEMLPIREDHSRAGSKHWNS
jgi:hypothetical protein